MIEFLKELNKKEFINEGCQLYEGTHYDEVAAKILSDVCDIETAKKVIETLIKEDWVSIFSHTDWIYKFLKPVARIYVEEVKKGKSLSDVIQDTLDLLGQFLIFVKGNKESKDKLYNFFDKAHIDDVQKFMDNYQKELEKEEASQPKPEYSSTKYEVIKIDSYEQLHSMFGGKWTGNGKSDKAADNTQGTGSTAWCHANDKRMWDAHTKEGKYLFFVAAKKNWKDIPPEKTEGAPFDTYGLSLIAIITTKGGKLLETTLRWNHVGVNNADHVFKTWNEINKACDQDIQKGCEEYFIAVNTSPFVVQRGVFQLNPDYDAELDLEEVVIPEGTKIIGKGVFSGWKNLRKVIIPDSVTKIRDHAFFMCKGLTSIEIPNSVTSIGEDAFSYCVSLADITIPDSLTKISDFTFYCCSGLSSVTISNSVSSIGVSAFYGCTNLTSINIPNSVTSIADAAFHGCISLLSIEIPNNVTSIGRGVFSDCESLTNVTIPDNLTKISVNLFYECNNLASIEIPDSVNDIGDKAFYKCNNLASITVPDNVKNIGDWAFTGCSNLKTIKCNNPKIVKLIKLQMEGYAR